MRVGDIVKLVWFDTGLLCHDMTLEEAKDSELMDVTLYGEVAHVDRRKVVIIQEKGRGDVGTFGIVARGAIKEVTILEPARPNLEESLDGDLTVSGWNDSGITYF